MVFRPFCYLFVFVCFCLFLFCSENVNLLILGAPRTSFTPSELSSLSAYVSSGGSVLLLLCAGGDPALSSNANAFLEEFGIKAQPDSVVRTVYHKYLHPKQVYIANGLLHPALAEAEAGERKQKKSKESRESSSSSSSTTNSNNNLPLKLTKEQLDSQSGLTFVYPHGCTLSVSRPAVPLLSSGPISFPLNRPVCAAAQSSPSAGRVVVLGSADCFADDWLEKEENSKLCDVLISYLVGSTPLPALPASTSLSVSASLASSDTSALVPDIAALADRLKPCLQEGDPLPQDFTALFDDNMFKFSTRLIPESVRLYETLNVKHEPLSLIPPQFECPLPPLSPAVFLPHIREPPAPALDQFDLDEHFASDDRRLAQLTNKCTGAESSSGDLEYYVRSAGEILGVTKDLQEHERDARHVLNAIFSKLVKFKMLNQDGGDGGGGGGGGVVGRQAGEFGGTGVGRGHGGGGMAGGEGSGEHKSDAKEGGGDVMTF